MVSEITRILKDYHDKKKYADDYFVILITQIISNYYNLEDYINGISVVKDVNGFNSRYIFLPKIVEYNLARINNVSHYHELGKEYYGMFNLVVLTTIFHELEHVRQEKVKDIGEYSLEKEILLLGDHLYIDDSYERLPQLLEKIIIRLKLLKEEHYYNKNYCSAPFERMAIITSCIEMMHFLDLDFINESKYYNLFNEYNNSFFNSIVSHKYKLKGELTNSPSLDYLYNLKKENKNIILLDKSLYDFNIDEDLRLFYGLVLTKYEYENIDDIKKTLIKRLSI